MQHGAVRMSCSVLQCGDVGGAETQKSKTICVQLSKNYKIKKSPEGRT